MPKVTFFSFKDMLESPGEFFSNEMKESYTSGYNPRCIYQLETVKIILLISTVR